MPVSSSGNFSKSGWTCGVGFDNLGFAGADMG
jgi:hypothetical protein